MKHMIAAGAALLATTTLATAGGIDRTTFTTDILFEEGRYLELSFGSVSPDVSGVARAPLPAIGSGDISPRYNAVTLAYHHDLTDDLSLSLVIDQPYGADVTYPTVPFYPFSTSSATIETRQLTAALRYEVNDNWSVYGGIRALQAEGNVYVSVGAPLPASRQFSYRMNADSDTEFGYMLGAAYERPDIAMRVALTYFSEIELGMSGVEGPAPGGGVPASAIPAAATAFNVTMPESILLEAQSGIAANTLLFGSLRWTNWDGFNITPNSYPAGSLVDYSDDVWTWELGVARRLNENWAVSAAIGYEAEQDTQSGNLGPTDGFTSISLGAEYTQGNISVAGGIRYIMIGDAETNVADFRDNDAIAVGIRLGIQF